MRACLSVAKTTHGERGSLVVTIVTYRREPIEERKIPSFSRLGLIRSGPEEGGGAEAVVRAGVISRRAGRETGGVVRGLILPHRTGIDVGLPS